MKALWLPAVVAAFAISTPAVADTVIFEQSGTDSELFFYVNNVPGAGTYHVEFASSIPSGVDFSLNYSYHYDYFLAPAPRPHEEFLEGNAQDVSIWQSLSGTNYSTTFVVPETKYTFFNANSNFNYLGIAQGTPLYREDKYESPYFGIYASALDYESVFDYTLKITKLGVTAAVPEPATWGMLIVGFALAGRQVRRRRAASGMA